MSDTPPAREAARAFIGRSRRYLTGDYPKRIRAALDRLPEEELWWRPNDASNSVGNLLVHLAGNVRQWIVAGVGGAEDVRRRAEEFSRRGGLSKDEALGLLEAAVRDADAVLERLDPETLLEPRTIQGREGTVLDAVYHVIEHFSMHTGQILWIVKARTGKPLGLWRVGRDGSAEPTW